MFASIRRFTVLLVLTVMSTLAMFAAPAMAQTAPAAQGTTGQSETSDKLEEVVVTARRRSESTQDVPIAVDTFTAAQIQAAGIENPRDFIAMVPNMTLVETQNVGNAFITVRGISQARNSEPSVAVLVDGVLEPNPYEFNQELVDVTHIEVLKGPQGALYGRDAIAGAIIINTADPPDHFEGSARAGVGNGISEKGQVALGGPLDSDGTLKFRASLNYYNTDGYLENSYLDKKADPDEDYTGRMRLLWKPVDYFTADLRYEYNQVNTTAYYYVIPRSDEANVFSSFTTPPNANDVTSPIQNNNLGMDHRFVSDTALKLDWNLGYGTVTSTSDINQTREIDAGDAYDFRPVTTSIFYNYFAPLYYGTLPASDGGPFDESQSQFIDVRTKSEELRFTSEKENGFSWIAGAYVIHTDRFISTGNLVDRGDGVPAVYNTPLVDPTNPIATNTNVTFLADAQVNNAWAAFADLNYEFNAQWELDTAIRYDRDQRQNTTLTPPYFLEVVGLSPNVSGEVRLASFDAAEPKATLRFKPDDDITLYGGWSRGFRSGGFNQTGVGAIAESEGVAGVHDLFKAEVDDTTEIGAKTEFLDHRLRANLSVFDTQSTNGYFFYYDALTSTQNLGNLNARYKGAELELTAKATDRLDLYANFGYTDSRITSLETDKAVIGNQAPLVSKNTIDAGAQYRQPLGNLNAIVRLDYQEIGRTWWDPANDTSRNPVNLIDLRAGLEADKWSVTAWSKNLTNKLYDAEYSPGGFLWRAQPRRYGVDVDYHF
jgi:iron complex outermembrane receptor protein